jgi:hypothetical protein
MPIGYIIGIGTALIASLALIGFVLARCRRTKSGKLHRICSETGLLLFLLWLGVLSLLGYIFYVFGNGA